VSSRVLIAPQELKGTLTAAEAARAICAGLAEARPGWQLDPLPLADGGPGTLDLVHSQRPSSRVHRQRVRDALGRLVEARWLELDPSTALVEMAEAAGLWRMGAVRTPLEVDTFGVGELIAAALDAGCKRVIVGAGGSATSDAGAGAAAALGARFLDARGAELATTPRALERCVSVDLSGLRRVPTLEVWTDVGNPLGDAARVYGRQKGAGPDEVAFLERVFATLSEFAPAGSASTPGAGAAGGLAFGLLAWCGARLSSGFSSLDQMLGLEARVSAATVVITAEGRLDVQSTWDKGPWALARLAGEHGVRCVAFVGQCVLPRDTWATHFSQVIELGPKEPAGAAERLRRAAGAWAATAAEP
jgi:glycerate kinase